MWAYVLYTGSHPRTTDIVQFQEIERSEDSSKLKVRWVNGRKYIVKILMRDDDKSRLEKLEFTQSGQLIENNAPIEKDEASKDDALLRGVNPVKDRTYDSSSEDEPSISATNQLFIRESSSSEDDVTITRKTQGEPQNVDFARPLADDGAPNSFTDALPPSDSPQTRNEVQKQPQNRQPLNQSQNPCQDILDSPQIRKKLQKQPQNRQPLNESQNPSQDVLDSPQTREEFQKQPQNRQPLNQSQNPSQDVLDSPQTREELQKQPQNRQPLNPSQNPSQDVLDSPQTPNELQKEPQDRQAINQSHNPSQDVLDSLQTRKELQKQPQNRQPLNQSQNPSQDVLDSPQTRNELQKQPQDRHALNQSHNPSQDVLDSPQTRKELQKQPQDRQPLNQSQNPSQDVFDSPQTRNELQKQPQGRQPQSQSQNPSQDVVADGGSPGLSDDLLLSVDEVQVHDQATPSSSCAELQHEYQSLLTYPKGQLKAEILKDDNGDISVGIVIAHALMSRKTQEAYKSVYKYVFEELAPELKMEIRVHMDFELAAKNGKLADVQNRVACDYDAIVNGITRYSFRWTDEKKERTLRKIEKKLKYKRYTPWEFVRQAAHCVNFEKKYRERRRTQVKKDTFELICAQPGSMKIWIKKVHKP
nr:PREDICTED: alpha-protein kinase 1-like [Fopius arisanus]